MCSYLSLILCFIIYLLNANNCVGSDATAQQYFNYAGEGLVPRAAMASGIEDNSGLQSRCARMKQRVPENQNVTRNIYSAYQRKVWKRSINSWAANHVSDFKKNESAQIGRNNHANSTNYGIRNYTAQTERRRIEGMFLKTTIPLQWRNATNYFNRHPVHNFTTNLNKNTTNNVQNRTNFPQRINETNQRIINNTKFLQNRRWNRQIRSLNLLNEKETFQPVKMQQEKYPDNVFKSNPEESLLLKKLNTFVNNFSEDETDNSINEETTEKTSEIYSKFNNLLNSEELFGNSEEFNMILADEIEEEKKKQIRKRTEEMATTLALPQITLANGIRVRKVLKRNEIPVELAKPLVQLTTLTLFNKPHDDTVLIQVPQRTISCPPPKRLARGRCRTV